MRDQLPQAQHTERQVLGGNQRVFIKQGCLHASKTNIHDGSSALDVFLEFRILCSDRLVADKTLLRVADDLYVHTGPDPELFQHDLTVSCLPHGAGRISPVFLHLILLHDLHKIL